MIYMLVVDACRDNMEGLPHYLSESMTGVWMCMLLPPTQEGCSFFYLFIYLFLAIAFSSF